MNNYPWQKEQFAKIDNMIKNNRLPHALLLSGQAGLGKSRFAYSLATSVLCQNSKNAFSTCHHCSSCQLIQSETHPDLLSLNIEGVGKVIKIDQVRSACEVLHCTAQKAGYKVVIIYPAEAMNVAASNALLKSLEEPSGKSLLILVSEAPDQLLPTIKSRCQELVFTTPDRISAKTWLQEQAPGQEVDKALDFALGAPLLALKLIQDDGLKFYLQLLNDLVALHTGKKNLVEISQVWKDYDLDKLVSFMMVWVSDLLKLKAGVEANLGFVSIKAGYQKYWAGLTQQQLLAYGEKLRQKSEQLKSAIAFNSQLFVEDMLVI